MEAILKNIIDLVESKSSFSMDDHTDTYLSFGTRAHGSVYNEVHSNVDVEEARKVINLIKVKYPDLDVKYEIETVDEWVNINILPPKKIVPIFYFIKHLGRTYAPLQRGFSEPFNSLEELSKRYGYWLENVDLINFNYGEIPQTKPLFDAYNKVVRVYDGGEDDYSFSIGFKFKELTQKFKDIFGSHE